MPPYVHDLEKHSNSPVVPIYEVILLSRSLSCKVVFAICKPRKQLVLSLTAMTDTNIDPVERLIILFIIFHPNGQM